MNLFVFLLISALLILGVEILKRKFLLNAFISRKITHVGAALIAVVSPIFLSKEVIVVFCFGFAGLLFVTRRTGFFSSIQNVQNKTFGEIFLPLGEAFSALVFLPLGVREFQFGVLVLGISDALAGIIGEKFGRYKIKIPGGEKSLEGSSVFFASTLVLTLLFSPSIGYHLLFIPLILTIIELELGYGADNLVLPILGASLLIYFT